MSLADSWYVIVILVVYNVLVCFADLKLVFHYMHEDDFKYKQGIVAQIAAVVSLQVLWLMFALLPTDAFSYYYNSGLGMDSFWELVFLFYSIFSIAVLPFAIFYYQADSDPRVSASPAWKKSLIHTAILNSCCWVAIAIIFACFHKCTVPVSTPICRTPEAANSTIACIFTGEHVPEHSPVPATPNETRKAKISFLCFLMALPPFVGWFPFSLVGGIGLAALPLRFIHGFVFRPKPIAPAEFEIHKKNLADRAALLKQVGVSLAAREERLHHKTGLQKQRATMSFKSDLNKFKQVVYLLEEEEKNLQISMLQRGENMFFAYSKLAFGIVCAIMSLCWLIQLLFNTIIVDLFHTQSFFPFLSTMFEGLRKSKTYVLDLLFFTIFAVYLSACTQVGSYILGSKFQKFFPVEPLRKHQTHLNTLLMHSVMVLLSGSAICQFTTVSLPDYATGTMAAGIFQTQRLYMPLFNSFYKHYIFEWILFVVSIISLIWLLIFPRTKPAIDLSNPKSIAKWIKLQKQLGIDENQAGAVKSPEKGQTAETPPADPNATPGYAERFKRKIKAMDEVAEKPPIPGGIATKAALGLL